MQQRSNDTDIIQMRNFCKANVVTLLVMEHSNFGLMRSFELFESCL